MKCLRQKLNHAMLILSLLAGWTVLSGCQTTTSHTSTDSGGSAGESSPSMVLKESDVVKISFPGAPSLDTIQTIRRDGKITMDKGELKAAGLTPTQLEQEVLKMYNDDLVVKQVLVTVQGSTFYVYVTGAGVTRPGKIVSDHLLTPLEAVIEAGMDGAKANLKHVTIIRESENGKTESFNLNLQDVMDAKPVKPFVLKSMDKIIVPEKLFSLF